MWKPAADYSVGTTSSNTVLLESLADPALRITAQPDLTPGDIVAWEGDAVIFSDGTFATYGTFSATVDYSAWGVQTMGEPVADEPVADDPVVAEPVVDEPAPEPEPTPEPAPEPEPTPEPEPEPEPVKEKGPPAGKGWRK